MSMGLSLLVGRHGNLWMMTEEQQRTPTYYGRCCGRVMNRAREVSAGDLCAGGGRR